MMFEKCTLLCSLLIIGPGAGFVLELGEVEKVFVAFLNYDFFVNIINISFQGKDFETYRQSIYIYFYIFMYISHNKGGIHADFR